MRYTDLLRILTFTFCVNFLEYFHAMQKYFPKSDWRKEKLDR